MNSLLNVYFICLFFMNISGAMPAFTWPSHQLIRTQVSQKYHVIGPNEHSLRRGFQGVIVTTNPVLIDLDLDLDGVVGVDLEAVDVCYVLSYLSLNHSSDSTNEVEFKCTRLVNMVEPPVFSNLIEEYQYTFQTWLVQSEVKSMVTTLLFEVSTIQHLESPPLSESTLPTYHSTVPYDNNLISSVKQCIESRSKLHLDSNQNEVKSFDESSPGLYAERVYHHPHLGFLGSPVRKVLNQKQIFDVGSLVHCVQITPRSDGAAYDGSVDREDFGSVHDATYEPHRLVNLNPFINAGVLPDVKDRIYEAVHAASIAGNSTHKVFASNPDGTKDYLLGFRVMEHLSYPPGVGLDEHEDEDSSLTISILISDASEYEGGEFALFGHQVTEDFHPGDGLVFESTRPHKVGSVTKGTRKVLVVELWPYPDGAIPSRVATPQKYPPPQEEVFGFTPASGSLALKQKSYSLLVSGEDSDAEKEDGKRESAFMDSYVVVRGGLVATGNLPMTSSKMFTWPEAVEACDRLLTCLAFTFLHHNSLLGNEDERNVQVYVEFKREASPIRIKGQSDNLVGAYGAVASSNGIPRWTAIKPWPVKTLLNEWLLGSTSKSLSLTQASGGGESTAITNEFITDYRECEEWALDGHCEHLKTFMNRHCNFFCESAW